MKSKYACQRHARHSRRTFLQRGISLLSLPAVVGPALAQGSVTRLIVPFPPGAGNDVVGRMTAEAISKKTGQSWIVENRPGAGSMLGTEAVAKAPPDGQTLLLCATANMGILPAIQKTVRYSVERDFTLLARIASSPFALTVNSKVPAKTFAEFVQLAKSKPEGIRIGTSGLGALDYMGASMLQSQLGLKLSIIPYKGMSPVLNDLRAGVIDASIVSPATIRPLMQDGHVRVLAVLDRRRNDLLPEVPSSVELGHPQLLVVNWWGIAGPSKMPPARTAALRQALSEVLADPAFLKSLDEKGFDPAVLIGDAFAQFVAADSKNWRELAQRAKITIEE